MKYFISLLTIALTISSLNGQVGLADYQQTCYCNLGQIHPKSIIKLDNNWEILKAMTMGCTLQKLDTLRISYTKSQIRLLQLCNLIRNQNGTYYTLFPILEKQETDKLRKESKGIAEVILPFIEPDILTLKDNLKEIGCEQNTYSILFSYVLDGLIWNIFEKHKLVDSLVITTEKPMWSGYFWAMTPKYPFISGTNEYSDDNCYALHINWSDAGGAVMDSILGKSEYLYAMMEEYKKHKKVKQDSIIHNLKNYKVLDNRGNIKIPIILENSQNRIYQLSLTISEKMYAKFICTTDVTEITKACKFSNNTESTVILWHEVMRALLKAIEEKEIIKKPVIFSDPEKANLENANELMFITTKG
ncbi:MAG: hypothetical protein HC830_03255 [Bacteroidetes bacterium]|nr:hypothetical protein [Bacteroidota bacterium]